MQFELECLNSDNCVDYEEFVKIFMEKPSYDKVNEPTFEVKVNKQSTY